MAGYIGAVEDEEKLYSANEIQSHATTPMLWRAGLNPARCLGPAIVRGGHIWDGHWVFWIGPAIAYVAFAGFTEVLPRQHSHATE
ncbi:unnamed protein product [Dovyalis caffra]|uniref:Uncharacterized protein n=1 Tax=Dovyalis caffra TaxID=77055 RepID=A0AAV1R6F6_9ROSI|nr:unnamed protein product [Dovyalis caffra]